MGATDASIMSADASTPAHAATLLTVGHGALPADEFAELLKGAEIEVLVDIRSFPGSRRHPHFGKDAMAQWVPDAGTEYRWHRELGGRRRPSPGSRHVALQHDAFRAYADHMETAEFKTGLTDVLELASSRRTAVMCSESVWWRCHRRLLSDAAMLLHAAQVEHLFHDRRLRPHPVMPEARVERDDVVYDGTAS
jgi:uncharacterized protein (DUF488 family)